MFVVGSFTEDVYFFSIFKTITHQSMSVLTGKVFYEALKQNEDVMRETGGRIYSTAIEVPPMDEDTTPLPYIILMANGGNNDQTSKDDFEGATDHVQIAAEIAADGTDAVLDIANMVRAAIHDYFTAVRSGEITSEFADLIPEDYVFSWDAVAWDWSKPCHFTTLHWACDTNNL